MSGVTVQSFPSLDSVDGKSKRIALLSARSSIHTVKWANGLVERGHDVLLISMHGEGDPLDSRVRVHGLKRSAPWGYLFNVIELRALLRRERPDLLHAHFVSGYGTLAWLTRFHPFVVSVWGTDIYNFPYRSFFTMWLVRRVLNSADWVCSTSQVMAKQTLKVCSEVHSKLTVTPFGISIENFRNLGVKDTPIVDPLGQEVGDTRTLDRSAASTLTIGTIKSLMNKYGVDTLIRGFAIMRTQLQKTSPDLASQLRLQIYGRGPQEGELKALIEELGLAPVASISGFIPHSEVPQALNNMDIYVAMSREHSESFGVAIIEASACERPVVVSNFGGLPEVVENGQTGIVVKENTPQALASSLATLCLDPELRREMGRQGRQRVLDHYNWEDNVKLMDQVYSTVLKKSHA